MFRRKNISYVIFKKFKHVSVYKSVEIHSSANANGIANGIEKEKIKSPLKEYVTWAYLKF